MPRRLFLHIGYYKTGSSALQVHLGRVRERLARRGVLYPSSGRPATEFDNHSGLVFQLFDEVGGHVPRWWRESPERRAYKAGAVPSAESQLSRELAASDAESVLLSSEELVRFGVSPKISAARVRALLDSWHFDSITVVCYLRRPDRYLESWYNQLVKLSAPIPRLSGSLKRYFGTEHTDFDRTLSFWMEQIGADRLVLRDYDGLSGGSIVTDFREATGLPIPDEEEGAGTLLVNPRIDNNFIEYARLWCLFRPRTNNDVLFGLLEDLRSQLHIPPLRDVYVLDHVARRNLHEYMTPVNERVGRLAGLSGGYFTDLDRMLEIPEHYISDKQAFRFWAPIIDLAVHARRIG